VPVSNGPSRPENSPLRVCQVLLKPPGVSETFFAGNASSLRAQVSVVHGPVVAHRDGGPVLSQSLIPRAMRKAFRVMTRRAWPWESTSSFMRAFADTRAQVVLAEYGETAVLVREACVRAGLPLVVHFHGYDISDRHVLARNRDAYREVFCTASAVVAVSRDMERRLTELGVPAAKLHYRPCGVDCGVFTGGHPAAAPPIFVAVGRFVEKKAPHLTVRAFARALHDVPHARLVMIGEGPLLGTCRDLVVELGLASSVLLLGPQPPEAVRDQLVHARAFVQHSVVAANGDSEGTPVSVLEAGACGLPIIGTRHGGIPDVVVENVTGLLVNEHDVDAMGDAMKRLGTDAALAARLGQAGAARVRECFSAERTGSRLYEILLAAASSDRR